MNVIQQKSSFEERTVADTFAFSPDQHFLAVGRKHIEIWDLRRVNAEARYASPTYRLNGQSEPVKAMRFVDAHTLEMIYEDGVRRWNLCTGEQIQ